MTQVHSFSIFPIQETERSSHAFQKNDETTMGKRLQNNQNDENNGQ